MFTFLHYVWVHGICVQYRTIQNTSIGPYFNENPDGGIYPIQFCTEKYLKGIIFGFNESFVFDSNTESQCIDIPLTAQTEFSSRAFLNTNNSTLSFITLLQADLKFTLKTVRFQDLGPLKSPDCFDFDIVVCHVWHLI